MPCIAHKSNGAPCTYNARPGFQTCGVHRRQEPVVQPVVQPVVLQPVRNRTGRCQANDNNERCTRSAPRKCYTCKRHRPLEQTVRDEIEIGLRVLVQRPVVNVVPQPVVNVVPQPVVHIIAQAPVHIADPEAGINLAAFANDRQSVHRSSVQKETENNIKRILEVPLLPNHLPFIGSSYFEFIYALGDIPEKRNDILTVYDVLWEECNGTITAFGTDHRTLFKHVWSYIQTHEHRRELLCRLCEEVVESKGMCSNGKMCRLINALQGFMDGLEAPVSKMEIFQNKIAKLMEINKTDRELEAIKLFEEFQIPEDQYEIWLAPLVEA